MTGSNNESDVIQSIQWIDNHVRILDQTYLPEREVYLDIYEAGRIWEAIRSLRIRGAPAIGIAASYGVYLGIRDFDDDDYRDFETELNRICDYLSTARPTAVNLQWAIDRAKRTAHALRNKPTDQIKNQLLALAQTIHNEDKRTCSAIGKMGLELVSDNARILTHCNTGSLATGKYGTALSIIYHANAAGRNVHVWVSETRPLFQGSRLTSWELLKSEIDHHVITDSMAGWVMKNKKVDLIIVGADRISRNGDSANKIGTYSLAVLARYHDIPFYVAAPISSFDRKLESGKEIPIEERDDNELRKIGHQVTAPKKSPVYNPAFDVTPHELITGIITEKGILKPDFRENISQVLPDY